MLACFPTKGAALAHCTPVLQPRTMRTLILALCAFALTGAAPSPWRTPDPATLLVIDTTKGQIIVEMRPDMAPKAVERITLLAREGVYDGLQFHRVIDNFVAQTGNPNNQDGGVSRYPDLEPEFLFRPSQPPKLVRNAKDGVEGFLGSVPIAGVSDLEMTRTPTLARRSWGAYCPGVAGMGRQASENTANAEIFFMLANARRLDRDYTVWGKVIAGYDALKAITIGEPPTKPDLMVRVRVASDLPPTERPNLQIMDENSRDFATLIAKTRAEKGADFTVCDVEVPVRVAPRP
jgi:peptidylprolyl isomerase